MFFGLLGCGSFSLLPRMCWICRSEGIACETHLASSPFCEFDLQVDLQVALQVATSREGFCVDGARDADCNAT